MIGCYRGSVAVAASGVYLAFDGGPDGSHADDAGIGPYDEIALRGARAVGERGGVGKVIALRSAAGSWRDAESSSSGSDQKGETGRGDLLLSAGSSDVLVRFSDDEGAAQVAVPDLGPFTRVVVGTYEVRGDEQTLAVRVSRLSPWQLTDKAGASFLGAIRAVLAFVATGPSSASRPRRSGATNEPSRSGPEPAVAKSQKAPTPPEDDAAPSVWVDRVKAAPDIYISRPDPKR